LTIETREDHRYLLDLISAHPFIKFFLNQIENAVYIVDSDSCFVYLNEKAEETDGYSTSFLLGKKIKDVYNLDYSPMMEALKTKKSVKEFAYRYIGNGKEVYQLSSAHPIVINNSLVGAFCLQRDISSLKEVVEENLLLQKNSYALSVNNEGAVDVDQIFSRLIGKSSVFLQCLSYAKSASQSDSPVFLTGSTGSGKEIFARCIHEASARRKFPFLAINCAAIPESLLESILFGTSKGIYTGAIERSGLFEQAKGGTLFLDEINSMPLTSQAKLLRVLEEKEVRHLGSKDAIKTDVRIISSSNVLPQSLIDRKQIREDLFFRLAVVNIIIPDLVKRNKDILLLTEHFINEYNKEFHKQVQGIDAGVRDFFLSFPWPGNIRQLKHTIESAMNFVEPTASKIELVHLPHYLFTDNSYKYAWLPSSALPTPAYAGEDTASAGDMAVNINPAEIQDAAAGNVFTQIDNMEKKRIYNALVEARGNVAHAAEILKISRQTLAYRMKKYGIAKEKTKGNHND